MVYTAFGKKTTCALIVNVRLIATLWYIANISVFSVRLIEQSDADIEFTKLMHVNYSVMFIVAIIPLILSPGIGGGELKSIRLSVGACTHPLTVDSLEAPLWPVVVWGVGVLPLAVVLECEAEEPASVWATAPALCGLFLLLFLHLRPFLG